MPLQEAFKRIKDPRRKQGQRINLEQLLSISILSVLSGYTGYRGMERFARVHKKALIEELGLNHPPPGRNTYWEVLTKLDKTQVAAAFNTWAKDLSTKGEWISGDGKALRATVEDAHGKSQNFEAIVSLFAQSTGLTVAVGHYKNKDKGGAESGLVRFLCGLFKGQNAVLSLDALHSTKKT